MVQSFHIETPALRSRPLSEALGAPVDLKMECLQPTGSFKLRGIGRACAEAARAGATHLVASSGGNAGLAVAHAGARLGVRTTVLVPAHVPARMRALIEAEGAEVVVRGESWDDTDREAQAMARAPGCAYIPPFDRPAIWDGHAGMIREAARQIERPGAVVVAVGGGGLLLGVLLGMHEVGWTDVPAVAVETEGAASLAASLDAGRLVTLERIASVATSLGARRIAPELLRWCEKHPVRSCVVSDRAAVSACARFLDDHRLLVEPACGAALAAVYDREAAVSGVGSVLVIVCGGANVTLGQLQEWTRAL